MKIYAATPITDFDLEQRQEMILLAHAWIDEWYGSPNVGDPPEVYMPLEHLDPDEDETETYRRNIGHLLESNPIIAFNPSLSRGCHFELGFGMGKLAAGKRLTVRVVNFERFPIDEGTLMLLGRTHENGDAGPKWFDHFDECVLRGTFAKPSQRCGCIDPGVELC